MQSLPVAVTRLFDCVKILDKTTLSTLEFPLILSELASLAATPLGMEAALSLSPKSTLEAAETQFQRYLEVASLIELLGALPIGGATDTRPLLKKASKEGAYLSCEEFSQVKSLLSSVNSLRSLASFPSFDDKYPITDRRLNAFSDQSFLTGELKRVIDDDGGISDRASPELLHIRRELKGMRGRARRLIDDLRRSEDFKEWLQEDFYTIRDDRYVLLIKAGYQTRFPGIIHGRSASGETYFIEPYKVVELNNELSLLKKDEKAEEIRILRELSKVVVSEADGLTEDQGIVGSFDLDSAKAAFSEKLGCSVPELGASGEVRLMGARHPLLILKGFTGDTTVRPVDIRLEEGVKVLVISGANTGGKTVALKTLGLITLMAQSAIPVPVSAGSRLRVFGRISADIGDSQGIAEDLSTFSGHIKRLGSFLADAAPGDLILIDEIGVGTDPSEGSVLSLALLEEFSARGAVTVVSTHMNLLKAHAAVDEAFMNATVIFDKETLEPSYNLSYGMPGQSLGLSIAGSLGIPESVVANARGKLTSDESAFIESLKDINRERDRLIALNNRLAAVTEARDLALKKLRDERAKIVERLKKRLEKKAKEAEDEIRNIVAALKEKEREARLKTGTADRAGRSAAVKAKAVARGALPHDALRPVKPYLPKEGDKVSVSGSSTKGIVVKVMADTKEVELKVGAMKIKAPWKKLEKTGGKLTRAEPVQSSGDNFDYSVDAAYSINIIGNRVEASVKLVTKFLDDAHLAGLPEVEIIHGKGTGVLGAAIREFLAGNPLVESYEQGDERGGGAGVTMVRLKG